MLIIDWKRRDFIKTVLAGVGASTLDWELLPRAYAATTNPDSFDAVVIGSGLGGLSCAAAFARQGFKPLVLEQHDKPGGYATAFKRPGGFEFDVSLHSTGAGERDGLHNLIPGFPEIKSVEFVPHPTLYRTIFPQHDYRVPNRNLPAYVGSNARQFQSTPPAPLDSDQGLLPRRCLDQSRSRLRRRDFQRPRVLRGNHEVLGIMFC